MSLEQFQSKIDVLDVSTCSFPERVCAAALQGLVNRRGPRLFLDYGIYDDPLARRTNEVFLDDEIWFGKYRAMLGAQDQRNPDYYCKEHGVRVHHASDLDDVVTKFRAELNGCVVWDADQPDTANIALMLAAQENVLVVEAGMLEWATSHVLSVVHDLRKEKRERSELYRWALRPFFQNANREKWPVLNQTGSALSSSTIWYKIKSLPITFPACTKGQAVPCFCYSRLAQPGCASCYSRCVLMHPYGSWRYFGWVEDRPKFALPPRSSGR